MDVLWWLLLYSEALKLGWPFRGVQEGKGFASYSAVNSHRFQVTLKEEGWPWVRWLLVVNWQMFNNWQSVNKENPD